MAKLLPNQLKELILSLKLYGEIPMKFAYLGRGAEAWSKVSEARMRSEFFTGAELKITLTIIRAFLLDKDYERMNLVDLGCGTGTPALWIADRLRENGVKIRYIPVDISPDLLERATKLFEERGYEVSPVWLDFDANPLKPALETILNDDPTIFLFLGNTLGNHSNEFHILTNIRQAMRPGDLLIVGLYIYNPFFLQKEYKLYMEDVWSKKLLYNIPNELFGINEENSEYMIEYVPDEHLILASIVPKDNIRAKILGETIELEKDVKIIVGRSKRYTEEEVSSKIKDAGFFIEHLMTDPRGLVAAVGIAPRRYT